jgi:hypothetical protein
MKENEMSMGVLMYDGFNWFVMTENANLFRLHVESTEGWSVLDRSWFFKEMVNSEIEGVIIDGDFKPHKPNMDWVYWKERCLAAEEYINLSPCDPDIYEEQLISYYYWKELVKNER